MGGRGGSSSYSGFKYGGVWNTKSYKQVPDSTLDRMERDARADMDRHYNRMVEIDKQLEGLRGDDRTPLVLERNKVSKKHHAADMALIDIRDERHRRKIDGI